MRKLPHKDENEVFHFSSPTWVVCGNRKAIDMDYLAKLFFRLILRIEGYKKAIRFTVSFIVYSDNDSLINNMKILAE